MASSSKTNSKTIGSIFECPICLDTFKDPKCLPCIHTFCLRCLQKYGKDKSEGDEIACPLCRQEFKIPVGGFDKLPNNFFIGNLLESFKDSLPVSGDKC